MNANNLELTSSNFNDDPNDEYSIPLDITDIITICREFNKLGWMIQNQVESILEIGVEEAIQSGNIKKESLPHIKSFLKAICNNVYFGDACYQSLECIELINQYEDTHQITYTSNVN